MAGVFPERRGDPSGAAVVPPAQTGPNTGFWPNLESGFAQEYGLESSVSVDRDYLAAYDEMLAVANRGRRNRERLPNPVLSPAGQRQADEQRLFSALADVQAYDPQAAAHLPKTPEELTQRIRERRARDRAETGDVLERGHGFLAGTGEFLGRMGGAIAGEPLNLATLPFGGVGRQAAMRIVTEGLVQAGIALPELPGKAMVHEFDRRPYDAGDMALDVALAGAGGVLFRGAGEAAGVGFRAARPYVAPPAARAADWFRAMVRRESGGKADAVSPKGALGVAQVMPDTARETLRKMGRPEADLSDAELRQVLTTNPDLNREIGQRYHQDMLDEFGGDPVKAAAAYNAGPANVREYERKAAETFGPDYNSDQFLQAVEAAQGPRGETAPYVRSVMQDLSGPRAASLRDMARAANDIPNPDPAVRGAQAVLEGEAAVEAANPFGPGAEAVRAHMREYQDALERLNGAPPPDGEAELRALDPALYNPGRPTGDIVGLDPDAVAVDAKRFQFKGGGDSQGVTERLRGVKTWDPVKAGVALVWQDEDGRLFVADGHQRLGLAKRLKAEGHDARIEARILSARDGVTAEDAMIVAATKNIAEGSGSPIDAARIFRVRPGVLRDLPPASALVRDGRDLTGLKPEPFNAVAAGVIPQDWGAVIGRLAADRDAETQLGIVGLLKEAEPETRGEAETLARDALDAGEARIQEFSLFGAREVSVPLMVERSKILAGAMRTLRRDRAAFNLVAREAQRLSTEGNILEGTRNASRAQADAHLLDLLQRLATRKGPISDALSDAARGRISGNVGREQAVRDFVGNVVRAARDGHLDRAGVGAGQRLAEPGTEMGGLLEPPKPPSAAERRAVEGFEEPAGEKAAAQADVLERELRGERQVPQDQAPAEAALPIQVDELDGSSATRTMTRQELIEAIDEGDRFLAQMDLCFAPPAKGGAA